MKLYMVVCTRVYILREDFLVSPLIREAIRDLLLAHDEGRFPAVGARADWDYVWLLVLQGRVLHQRFSNRAA